jgi:hypothetical protein
VPDGLTLEQIKAQPHGVDMGPMVPRSHEMVCTPDGKIDLAPEYIVGDLPRLREKMAEAHDGLRLVSRRHLRSKNSWMHNVKLAGRTAARSSSIRRRRRRWRRRRQARW